MPSDKLTFTGHDGSTLAARFDRPSGDMRATAVFAHCFTCTKDIPAARRISSRLAANGIGVLRFDFTGLGHSAGEFANTHFSSNVADLVAAANHLGEVAGAPSLLIGHSLGGAAVIKAAAELPSVKAVATIGAPADPAHVVHNFGCTIDEIKEKGEAEVSLAGRPFTIRKSFLDDVAGATLTDTLKTFKKAILVLHAPGDDIVGIESAAEIFTAARHPKSFVTLDDADHLVTRAADAEYAAEVIAAWSARYLDVEAGGGLRPAPDNGVRVTEADPEGFLQDVVTAEGHHTLADEPVSYGGTNMGGTPYDYLAAGLGACTSMTIRMYARRKKIALRHVSVDVVHSKIHAADCANCEQTEGKVDRFHRLVRLEGDLDEATRARLLEIADRCPVHRTMEGEMHIVTEAT